MLLAIYQTQTTLLYAGGALLLLCGVLLYRTSAAVLHP